jgi:hypothetical protein
MLLCSPDRTPTGRTTMRKAAPLAVSTAFVLLTGPVLARPLVD